MKEKTTQKDEKLKELYDLHKESIQWYISESFHPSEAIDKVLDGSPLDYEYELNLRHIFGS